MLKENVEYVLIFCLMSWILSLFLNILVVQTWAHSMDVELQKRIAVFDERKVWIRSVERRLDALLEKQGK